MAPILFSVRRLGGATPAAGCRKFSIVHFQFSTYSASVTIVIPAPPRSACSSTALTTSGTVRR